MLKYILSLFILISSAGSAFCALNGELESFDDKDQFNRYGLFRIMQRKPIVYSITVVPSFRYPSFSEDQNGYSKLVDRVNQQIYEQLVEDALKA